MLKKPVLFIGILIFSAIISQSQNSLCDSKYLIVLDVQSQFYANKPFESSATEMIANLNSLIGQFSPERVIYVKSTGKILNISGKGIKVDTMAVPDLDGRLRVVSKNIFVKVSTGDSFSIAELDEFLKKNSVKEILLTGLLAEKCITQTAIGGMKRGFDIFIIPDGVIGKTPKSKEKALKKLEQKGIRILSQKECS